jgi:erythritol/L-threitol dehydrogenase
MAAKTNHASLPRTMQAVVCHGPEDYRLEEWSVPEPGPGEVVIRVGSVGICASDLKCYLGAPLFWGDRHRTGYCQPPVIPGHEFVGDVVALGEGAAAKYGLAIGDRAVSEQIVPCWNCRYCRNGQYWMCHIHDIYGFRQRTFGAMAEYMLFPVGALN